MLVDGEPQEVSVVVGAVGGERTEVTAGLNAGDVVLAELQAEIETSEATAPGGLSAGRRW